METLDDVFAALHPLLARHADALNVVKDEPGDLQVQTRKLGPSGTPMSFGAVKVRTESVRFQLMPVHSHPAVIEHLSEPLRSRMRGGGTFELTPETLTPELHAELSALVDGALDRYRSDGLA